LTVDNSQEFDNWINYVFNLQTEDCRLKTADWRLPTEKSRPKIVKKKIQKNFVKKK